MCYVYLPSFFAKHCLCSKQRNPEVESRLGGLGGLGTVEELDALTETSAATSASGARDNIGVALERILLADVAVPADTLVGRNEVLVVEALNIRGVLVEGVAVDGELDLLDEALADELDVRDNLGTNSWMRCRGVPIRGVLSRHGGNGAMNDHRLVKLSLPSLISP